MRAKLPRFWSLPVSTFIYDDYSHKTDKIDNLDRINLVFRSIISILPRQSPLNYCLTDIFTFFSGVDLMFKCKLRGRVEVYFDQLASTEFTSQYRQRHRVFDLVLNFPL